MSDDLLTKLKALQMERSDTCPFSSHLEYQKWSDTVSPLLAFNPELKRRFDSLVSTIQASRPLSGSEQQEIININTLIGLLNQAVTSLELNPIQSTAAQPASIKGTEINNWHQKPLGNIALSVIGGLLLLFVAYLIKTHVGIPL